MVCRLYSSRSEKHLLDTGMPFCLLHNAVLNNLQYLLYWMPALADGWQFGPVGVHLISVLWTRSSLILPWPPAAFYVLYNVPYLLYCLTALADGWQIGPAGQGKAATPLPLQANAPGATPTSVVTTWIGLTRKKQCHLKFVLKFLYCTAFVPLLWFHKNFVSCVYFLDVHCRFRKHFPITRRTTPTCGFASAKTICKHLIKIGGNIKGTRQWTEFSEVLA